MTYGLSPRVWGNPLYAPAVEMMDRSIPTGMGKPFSHEIPTIRLRVYRVWGNQNKCPKSVERGVYPHGYGET